jgi:hypothetical protein
VGDRGHLAPEMGDDSRTRATRRSEGAGGIPAGGSLALPRGESSGWRGARRHCDENPAQARNRLCRAVTLLSARGCCLTAQQHRSDAGSRVVDRPLLQAGRRQRSAAGASIAGVARVRNEVAVGGKAVGRRGRRGAGSAVAAEGGAESLVAGRNRCRRGGGGGARGFIDFNQEPQQTELEIR